MLVLSYFVRRYGLVKGAGASGTGKSMKYDSGCQRFALTTLLWAQGWQSCLEREGGSHGKQIPVSFTKSIEVFWGGLEQKPLKKARS